MIYKKNILSNLKEIEVLFDTNSRSAKKGLFFSKLAILELCGWIEESMDDMILRTANAKLNEKENIDFVKEYIVKTYGFEYDKHFRIMLIKLIGIINLERLEGMLDAGKFQKMVAALKSLKKVRDAQAHTHLTITTKILDAPSVTKNKFKDVYDGLSDIDKKMNRIIRKAQKHGGISA